MYKRCRNKCRFLFGHFFTKRTIARPLNSSLTSFEKNKIKYQIDTYINSAYINDYLNPSKLRIFYDQSKEDFIELKSIIEILIDLVLSESTYYFGL